MTSPLKQMREMMQVCTPAPEEKVRELASAIARKRPEISVDGFLLPRDEGCNFQWNTISTRSFTLLLEWYLDEKTLLNAKAGS